ncbi:MAG: ACP S-malonyltransferase [Spirochaetota bacterium]
MKTCFLFPGQGAQYPGMGKDLWETSPRVKELFQLASDTTSMDLKKLLFEGSEEELKSTNNTQVAVTLVNTASAMVLKEKGIIPEGVAGFSLGEYSALWEAGVIALKDLFPIVKARGEFMEKNSRKLDTEAGAAGMAAVVGLSIDDARPVLENLKGSVFMANHSSPIQIVLAGTSDGLKKAEKFFEEAGAMKYVFLKVSGPFHSPLLEEAKKELESFLNQYTFNDPGKPVYANYTGQRVTSGAEAKQNCVQQVVSTVKWVDIEQNILDDGFERFIETGPGSVLAGLWKSFNRKERCKAAGTLADIQKIVEESKG